MGDWKDTIIKTWLSWPKFDPEDHESCDLLDRMQEKFNGSSPHLPYDRRQRDLIETEKMPTWQFGEESPDTVVSLKIEPWRLS